MTDTLSTWRFDLNTPVDAGTPIDAGRPIDQTSSVKSATPDHTLVFASFNKALPVVVYCGAALPIESRLDDIARADTRPLTPGTLDQLAPLSLLPEEGQGFHGYCGLRAEDKDGKPALTQFQITSVEKTENTLCFCAEDQSLGLAVCIRFSCEANSEVLQAVTELRNIGGTHWRVSWLSVPVLPIDQSFDVMQEYRGRWTQEFTPVKSKIKCGVQLRESVRGRTGHDHFPGLIVGEAPLAWTRGRAAAMHYSYSDVHRTVIESLPDGRRQAQAGVAETRQLSPNTKLDSGTAYWAFSQKGINQLANKFQQFVRSHLIELPTPNAPRYVNYNCWEAIYFDHTIERLKNLAESAAAVGAERFVLDDGWFGTPGLPRNDDTTSLGDWFVDEDKYPDGLTPLIEHVNGLGMRFGLWFEPEMVNLNSALAKQNPSWVLKHGDVRHVEGRQQYLLDLTNPDVAEYLFECLHTVLSGHNIEYIKWDMNRDATRAVDASGYRSLVRHSDAVQALMTRIRQSHPKVEIESCASGGGRIDYRVLQNTHRVWLSDSIDARVRWKMQSEAFVFIPPSVYGSHVGAEKAHTSARKQPMSLRAMVAMTGHMGIESDMAELNEHDRHTLMRYISLYKEHRQWMHSGSQYRLDTPQTHTLAQQFVASNLSQFMLFSATLDVMVDETTAPLRLVGLDPQANYSIKLINKDDIDPLATRTFDHPLVNQDATRMSGVQLMQQGIVPPFPMPDSMWLFYGAKIST